LLLRQEETDQALQVCSSLKVLLTAFDNTDRYVEDANDDNSMQTLIPLFERLQDFVENLLELPLVPHDGFNTLGILYGKLICTAVSPLASFDDYSRKEPGEAAIVLANICTEKIATLNCAHSKLSSTTRLSIVQGIAAMIPANALTCSIKGLIPPSSPLYVCWRYSLNAGNHSMDSFVQWAALKGLSTLISRWKE
jgi:hypothetical protein